MENIIQPSASEVRGRSAPFRFYQTLFLKAMRPMNRGLLHLNLPTGERIELGSKDGGIQAQIRVLNPIFFKKCVLYGEIGFGESYMDGDWETDSITQVISWMILNIENAPGVTGTRHKFSPVNILKWVNRVYHRFRMNSIAGSRKNIAEHYDLSNDFFRLFLDETMTYSCAYFRSSDQTLEEAQSEKYDRLCRKLKIKSSDQVLEIGCGWGGFAVHAVKNYGCRVTALTISQEQFFYAQARFQKEEVADRIDLRLLDYRDVTGQFDKIVSIEMLEAVGHEYLETFFRKCHHLLKKDGILGLEVIITPDSRYEEQRKNVNWIQKHIFPGSLLPSIAAMNQAIHQTGEMFLRDLKDLGTHYAHTLALWRKKFNEHVAEVRLLGFDEKFIRKWNYYLSYCEAGFQMRDISVVQMIYTRPNNTRW